MAIVPIVGSLVHRGAWIGASSGLISYEGLTEQLRQVGTDPHAKAVVLDIECPGGQAIGAFETAKVVRDLAAVKPVTAVVNGLAASAAYAIASGASRIITIPSGVSGSIGVVMMHIDRSRALAKAGLKPTFIHAGARKVDGHPFAALPDDVRDSLQAEVEAILDAFVATVAAGRPGLSEKAIRSTEARTYTGEAAVKAGLADAVGTFDDAVADAARVSTKRPTRAPARTGAGATITRSKTVDEDEKRIRAEERGRIRAIMGSEHAQDRQAQALAVALETSLSPEEASAILRVSPKVEAGASDAEKFIAAKEGRQPLNLEAEDPKGERKASRINAGDIYAARRAAAAKASAEAETGGRR
ncbi:S49 family peptidase [Methylobacterium sp. J-070]|uniref:S49 family peptidase n=1 Tax=Methylobacterium sp. J-070 TaxID=2836650 RepID=UPI001FB966EC|nr:S49 family peptidase [Methylobacterium sp. J-070]MCJ2051256.1 S49 family peptidase [Methylobacterium sp. J-070]